MTKAVFESATLIDAIRKAEQVAPSKGSAFDKAAGIVIDIYNHPAEDPSVVIRATDTDVYYMEWVDVLEVSGESTTWRLPSKLFAGLLTSLPIGTNETITLEEIPEEKGRLVHLTNTRRTRCKFGLIDPDYYPGWMPFDGDDLSTVSDLGGRISQVAWAAAKGEEKINGVHFDGETAVATDRYRLVKVPFKMTIDKPITIPGDILSSLLRQTGDVRVGTDGHMFLIMPDDHCQIKTTISGLEYPKVERIMTRDYPWEARCRKQELLEIIGRSLYFTGADRYPMLRLFLGRGEINVFMADSERAMFGDSIELPGQIDHPRVEIKFTPKNLIEALENAPNDEVNLYYDPEKPLGNLYIDGGSGYECWVVPRRGTEDGR